jgi:hypothetical protein
LKRSVSTKWYTTAEKVTELNIHLEDPVSTKNVRRELHKSNMHGRAAIAIPLTIENAKRRKRWCDDHKTWTSGDWKYVIRSEELFFTLFPISGRVYVWKTPKGAYNSECLVPTVQHEGGSVMIWAAISWYSVGPIIVWIVELLPVTVWTF